MGAWSWLAGGGGAAPRRVTAAGDQWASSPQLSAQLAAAQEARVGVVVATREQAMGHSVVNRARDLICGTLAGLPFTRTRTLSGVTEDLGPGWLDRPDPTITRGELVAAVTDDLFFHGRAWLRVTVRDAAGFPAAVQHVPYVASFPTADGGLRWLRTDDAGYVTETAVPPGDVIRFRSFVSGVLEPGGPEVLSIGSRLDGAASRFASTQTAAGILNDDGTGEPMTPEEAAKFVQDFQAARLTNTVAYLRGVAYTESTLDPSRLQLVEGRSYQDAAVARLCNVPAFTVGVGVPNDSMTYKTAQTARLDLVDFGLAPYLSVWEQVLSGPAVTPRGTVVGWDLTGFLRTTELTGATPAAETPGGTP